MMNLALVSLLLLILVINAGAAVVRAEVELPEWAFPDLACAYLEQECYVSCEMYFFQVDRCMNECLEKKGKTFCAFHENTQNYHPVQPKKSPAEKKIVTIPRIIMREHERNYPLKTEDGTTLWEGDMILNENQVNFLWGRGRKAEAREEYLWPDGTIPYSISQSSMGDRKVIMAAINHWMVHTCLKFHEVPEDIQQPHLIFQKKIGCSSSVGRQSNLFPNGQSISVGEGCEEMGLVAHEIGHAIGFYHEHSRADRDESVKILNENVKPTHQKNFNVARYINSHNIPYDIHSVMHYTSKAFTVNGRNTIVTKDPLQQLAIGQRKKLSYYDIMLANDMYCKNKQPLCGFKCLNKGIVDMSCNCVCPPEFEGERCAKAVVPKCGGNITKEGIITTPNYPKKYPEDSRCIWWITAPSDKTVKVKFIDFDLMSRAEQNNVCEWDSVEVRGVDSYEGEFYCGDEKKGRSVTSVGNQIIIFFATEYGSNRGFKANITFEDQPQFDYIF